jgi:hypothetical protein
VRLAGSLVCHRISYAADQASGVIMKDLCTYAIVFLRQEKAFVIMVAIRLSSVV